MAIVRDAFDLTQRVRWALRRWTNLEVNDYAGVLHLREDYRAYNLIP